MSDWPSQYLSVSAEAIPQGDRWLEDTESWPDAIVEDLARDGVPVARTVQALGKGLSPANVAALAAEAGLSPRTVGRHVSLLHREGYIERGDKDGFVLTEKGHQLVPESRQEKY